MVHCVYTDDLHTICFVSFLAFFWSFCQHNFPSVWRWTANEWVNKRKKMHVALPPISRSLSLPPQYFLPQLRPQKSIVKRLHEGASYLSWALVACRKWQHDNLLRQI